MEKELREWTEEISRIHLPRWEELPDVTLYKEEVITLISKYVGILVDSTDSAGITPSMINNYVKWKMIPPPVKKQYDRVHLGYLIAITILKQAMPIGEIKDGIKYQSMVNGTHNAYNYFCEEQEKALRYMASKINPDIDSDEMAEFIPEADVALKMATIAFAAKLISLKKVKIQETYLGNDKKRERKYKNV